MTSPLSEALVAPILVVEDSDEDFDTLREAATAAGVTRLIRRAVSGGECLAMLRGEGDMAPPLLPVLILMDLNSHGVDGREALVAIKTDEALKEIPMVVLTTSANPKDVAFCFQAGANAYHVKPVRHDQYLVLLGALLRYWLESVTLQNTRAKAH
ncbi:response regulator [Polaromonas sp.]|uniref:response regulator n=1 Tax=Polaromonas sp. TaxID=1869339 RepID=UPI003752CD4A